MSLAEYLALSDRVAAVNSREETLELVSSITHANLSPIDRRVLARRLAKAAQTIDPALALAVVTSILPAGI